VLQLVNRFNSKRLAWLIGALVVLVAAGCKTKRVLEKSPLVPLGDNALLELVEAHTFDFESLNAKISANFRSKTQNNAFKINLRMREDSAVWLSVSPALGIEAARVLIRPDSVFFIDKIKNQYYTGGFEALDTLINYYADFNVLQNLLVGNPIEISPDEKYNASVDGLHYVLATKTKRKLRKSIEPIDDLTGTSRMGVVKERKLEKAKAKYPEEDLILKRYFISPKDFRVVRAQIDDILYSQTLRVEYSRFEEVDGRPFPMNVTIEVSSLNQSAKFELQYTRIRTNETQTYPFKIPAKYTPLR